MVVGVLSIELRLHGVHSLKDKRSVVRKVLSRVRNEFPVSAAEVEHQDVHQTAGLGMAVVSGDARLANSILDQVINFVDELQVAEVGRTHIEILHV